MEPVGKGFVLWLLSVPVSMVSMLFLPWFLGILP